MGRIDASPEDLAFVVRALSGAFPEREVRAFGSRVTGTASRFSDLDVVIMGDEPVAVLALAELREALTQSRLPFKVDIVLWSDCSERFRGIIRQDSVALSSSADPD